MRCTDTIKPRRKSREEDTDDGTRAGFGAPRVDTNGARVREVERYDMDRRIRDLTERADGTVWLFDHGLQASTRRLPTPTPR